MKAHELPKTLRRLAWTAAIGAVLVSCGTEAKKSSMDGAGGVDDAKTPNEPSEPKTEGEDGAPAEASKGQDAKAERRRPPRCKDGGAKFSLAEESVIRWVAMKNGSVPVTGVQGVQGSIEVPGENGEDQIALHLSFDPSTLDSGIPIRDERIRKYLLGLGNKLPSFHLEAIQGEAPPTLPALGQTERIELSGRLEMMGRSTEIEVPVLVTGIKSGYRVTEDVGGFTLDFRDTLGMSKGLESLIELAGVEIADEAHLQFDLLLETECL